MNPNSMIPKTRRTRSGRTSAISTAAAPRSRAASRCVLSSHRRASLLAPCQGETIHPRSPESGLPPSGQSFLNFLEPRPNVRADRADHGDDHCGDERDHDPVLNRGRAPFPVANFVDSVDDLAPVSYTHL